MWLTSVTAVGLSPVTLSLAMVFLKERIASLQVPWILAILSRSPLVSIGTSRGQSVVRRFLARREFHLESSSLDL